MPVYLVFFLLLFSVKLEAITVSTIQGFGSADGKKVSINLAEGEKFTTVVFLSAVCPCSNGHIPHLKELVLSFPDVNFLAVHSNSNEDPESVHAYFKGINLPFPVIYDKDGSIAETFNAARTPHAFLVSANGTVVYEGGVTNHSIAAKAEKKFLLDALKNVKDGHEVQVKSGVGGGCGILRKKKD